MCSVPAGVPQAVIIHLGLGVITEQVLIGVNKN